MSLSNKDTIIALVQTKQHSEDLKKIYQEVYVEEQEIAASLVFAQSNEDIKTFILYSAGDAVSTGRVRYLHHDHTAKVERMATLKSSRGKGFAEKILLHLIQVSKSEYPQYQIMLHSQKSANPFYEKLGWIKIGEEFIEADIIHQKYIYGKN